MGKIEAYRSLAEVRDHKQRLRAERDRVQEGLKAQLELVREPAFRKGLMGDAFGDMLQAWRPLKRISHLLGGTAGTTSKVLGVALGAKAKTPTGRIMVALAGFVLPALMEKFDTASGMTSEKLQRELIVSWERVKEYVNERRTAREEAHNE
ncbi:MAG: hypothetical protein JNL43_14265 [Flavobacteriales bacterium]|nr:hypothetical protein [Flavobacteriales bacterium]